MAPFSDRSSCLAALSALALLVSACATKTAVPVREASAPRPVVVSTPPVSPVAPAQPPAAVMPPPSAVRTPAPAPAPVAADPDAPPYGPAVAARFPDPAVSWSTPAFAADRTTFTSNDELLSAMRSLVREGDETTPTIEPIRLGTSQTGVPLEALLFTRLTDTDPAVMRAARPTVLLVAQQHGNEPAGGEAMLVIAQELARGRLSSVLDRINVIVLPRANPDGAQGDRRVSASGIDVNRDHLLLKTPEAQAMARLMRDYRPAVVVDAHEYTVVGRWLEKFGTVQKFDALVQYAMTANLPEFVSRASEQWFRQPLLDRLKGAGFSHEWYHTTSVDPADKRIAMGGVKPDTGRNVNGLRNAISFLIETRGVGIGRMHLKRRVQTHVVAISSLLDSAASHADDLVKLRGYVDNETSAKACQGEMTVDASATSSEYALTMLDPTTGADRVVNVAWESALELKALTRRPRPCGYWLAADQQDAVLRLRGLGLTVQQTAEPGALRGDMYRETSRQDGVREDVRGSIADGGSVVRVTVDLLPMLIDVPAGSYYVPLDQPLANLAIAALEPDTQSSYLSNRIVTAVDRVARVMLRPEVKLVSVP